MRLVQILSNACKGRRCPTSTIASFASALDQKPPPGHFSSAPI
jgi:hypothetical protein